MLFLTIWKKPEDILKPEYETITGEVKTIRAYYIFKLLQFFAPYNSDKLGIPLNLDSRMLFPEGWLSQREVYRIVIRELEDVLEYETVMGEMEYFLLSGDCESYFSTSVYV